MEASLQGFFKTLLILIIVYYAFKFFFRILFPLILKGFINKAQKKFYEGSQNFDPQANKSSKEGEVKVKTKANAKTEKKIEGFGEYVDYEEIKE